MGTARIAADEGDGVCAADGSVHGVSGLYVADASLFPTSVGVNPMMTIIAFAKQVAAGIASASSGRAELLARSLRRGGCRALRQGLDSTAAAAGGGGSRRRRRRRRRCWAAAVERRRRWWRWAGARRRLRLPATAPERRSAASPKVTPFLLHRPVAAEGDPGGRDQAEEDAELAASASTETPPRLAKLGGSMMRKRISRTEIAPRTVTTTLIGTGGS